MRVPLFLIAAVLAACAAPQAANVTSTTLVSADAATSLMVGERITQSVSALASGPEGDDPVVNLSLRHGDGRVLAFQEANHAPNDLFVQSAGGALAQIMGLTGDEVPALYYAANGEGAASAPFICGPQGPAAIGRYEAADGSVRIVGLRQPIQVETRPDGQTEAVPYSPNQVCARLNFHKG
jgi:hypothetical protein